MTEVKNKTGRPEIYTPEIAEAICMRLANGESLRSICRDDAMPGRTTVTKWIIEDKEGFANQYARAKDIGLDEMADEIFDIADDSRNDWIERQNAKTGEVYEVVNDEAISRARLRVDARKWYLSKLAPKRYGERLELAGDEKNPLRIVTLKDDDAKL